MRVIALACSCRCAARALLPRRWPAYRVLVVEQNHGGQLYRYLRSMVDLPGRLSSFHRLGLPPFGAWKGTCRGHRRVAARRPNPRGRAHKRRRILQAAAFALTAADRQVADRRPAAAAMPGPGLHRPRRDHLRSLLQLLQHEVAVVSGIGCSSRIPAYTSCYGFHGVHGRVG